MKKIKISFWWTPELSACILEDINKTWLFDIVYVVTGIDKPIWRKQILTPNPVKHLANKLDLQIFQPEKIRWNKDFFDKISSYDIDYAIVVAYGKILPKEILELPSKMCINVHGSILPNYRGASPIQSALMDWDEITWVTIMKMWEWMDDGDIIGIKEINIDKLDNVDTLFKKFEIVSWEFLTEMILWLEKWISKLRQQDFLLATYCKKISKEDWLIDFSLSSREIFNKWKWLTPWPWIFTFFEWKKLIITKCDYLDNTEEWEIGKIIKNNNEIWIICWKGVLILKEVKLEWKNNQNIKDFINGKKDFIWSVLGCKKSEN